MNTDEENVKVAYIAGSGRSGSTLLERLLGMVDGFFNVGELAGSLWYGFTLEKWMCSCGRPMRECAFWNAVLKDAFGRFPDEAEAKRISALGESLRFMPWLKRLFPRRYLRVLRLPLLLRFLRTADFCKRLAEYHQMVRAVYSAVRKASGCRLIVDASCSSTPYLILRETPGIDLYLLHLVRDSRAVAFSCQREKAYPAVYGENRYMARFGPAHAALSWNRSNLWAGMMGPSDHPHIFVRYEDLADDPRWTLSRIAAVLEGNRPSIDFIDNGKVDLGVCHTVSGNPMRFQKGRIDIRPDMEWREKMGRRQLWIVTALTWPLLLRYGYLGKGGASVPGSAEGHRHA